MIADLMSTKIPLNLEDQEHSTFPPLLLTPLKYESKTPKKWNPTRSRKRRSRYSIPREKNNRAAIRYLLTNFINNLPV